MVSIALKDVVGTGDIDAPALARKLRLSMVELAQLARVSRNTLSAVPLGPKAREALSPIVRILSVASEMAGSEHDAVVWFKYTPIVSMGVKTAEEHVRAGDADIVLTHLEDVQNGVYA